MPHAAASTCHPANDHRDELQFAVAFNVGLTGRLWRAHFADRMKALHQTDARWCALYTIADASIGINQVDLAQRLGVQGPTLVRLLDGLERQGLVSRHAAPGDRRANSITIETKGREMLAVLDSFAVKMRNEVFEGVSDADLTTTLRVLRHSSRRLGVAPADQPDAVSRPVEL